MKSGTTEVDTTIIDEYGGAAVFTLTGFTVGQPIIFYFVNAYSRIMGVLLSVPVDFVSMFGVSFINIKRL